MRNEHPPGAIHVARDRTTTLGRIRRIAFMLVSPSLTDFRASRPFRRPHRSVARTPEVRRICPFPDLKEFAQPACFPTRLKARSTRGTQRLVLVPPSLAPETSMESPVSQRNSCNVRFVRAPQSLFHACRALVRTYTGQLRRPGPYAMHERSPPDRLKSQPVSYVQHPVMAARLEAQRWRAVPLSPEHVWEYDGSVDRCQPRVSSLGIPQPQIGTRCRGIRLRAHYALALVGPDGPGGRLDGKNCGFLAGRDSWQGTRSRQVTRPAPHFHSVMAVRHRTARPCPDAVDPPGNVGGFVARRESRRWGGR